MREQVRVQGLLRTLRKEAPYWRRCFRSCRGCWHRALAGDRVEQVEKLVGQLLVLHGGRNRMIAPRSRCLRWRSPGVFLTA